MAIKRFIKKDGSQRISFYREDDADNPRYMYDEPLHCADWARDGSIMNKQEREGNSSSARELLERMIVRHADWKNVIDFLVENGKHMMDGKCKSNDALVYNKSEHRWDLMSNMLHYNSKTQKNEMGWCLSSYYYEKKYCIDLYGLLEDVCDSTINHLAQNFLGNEVKIMSYGFGYYGDLSFYHDFSTDSEGIAWLEKDEFLKYSGCKEEYWNGKTLDEIEFLLDELKAWCDNEVYGYKIEEGVKVKITKEYLDDDHEIYVHENTEWKETDTCWGFYGELNKSLEWMFGTAGLKQEEFEEE